MTKKTGGPVDPLTAKIAESMSKTTGDKVEPSQVLLKLAQQMGAIVITTSGKEFRMKEQLAVGSLPEIEAADVKALVEAGKSSHQRVFMPHSELLPLVSCDSHTDHAGRSG